MVYFKTPYKENKHFSLNSRSQVRVSEYEYVTRYFNWTIRT